ncbi:hypothetical protein EYF80_005973 [Liparis tanakae]|uniref:Uncharacterized protein n=1 Tax=Liparis tanakae TaxID=230148 RepID=A0A4Z2J185_9TELE|nr:hypothetical protein EYF80_005973 [Liparis tanakae]
MKMGWVKCNNMMRVLFINVYKMDTFSAAGASPHANVSMELTWARLEANPFVNGSRYQHSVCTVLDREKYSTLHTCGTKILPCEEDGMIVVLGVVGVAALLRVGPSTHLLQAAGRVATLDQAYGL